MRHMPCLCLNRPSDNPGERAHAPRQPEEFPPQDLAAPQGLN